jgi:hypothetical protein
MKMSRAILTAALVVFSAGLLLAQKETTLEGTLVDSKCYLSDNSLAGNDHGPTKNCGTMCLKGGTPAGILSKDKKFHALIAPAGALADYVGQQVRATGSLHNGSLLAKKVEVNRNGKWEEVKLGAMM